MMPLDAAERVRFVLVAPSHAGNIGAAARALKVMGFSQLALVAPRNPGFRADAEAIALAVGAADVLKAATVHVSLAEALTGVQFACAMTGYAREFGPRLLDLRSAAAAVRAHLSEAHGAVAFVFGTERSGLLNDDIERCQACVAIAADTAFGSLNLAQAVQVAAYECRLALMTLDAPPERFASEPPATVDALEAMYVHLEQALVALGYLDPAQPRRLMSRLRRLLNRAHPSAAEIDILRGICAAIIARKDERRGKKQSAR